MPWAASFHWTPPYSSETQQLSHSSYRRGMNHFTVVHIHTHVRCTLDITVEPVDNKHFGN